MGTHPMQEAYNPLPSLRYPTDGTATMFGGPRLLDRHSNE